MHFHFISTYAVEVQCALFRHQIGLT